MELNLTEILLALLQKYGLAGVALGFWFFSMKSIDDKLDRLMNLNNKTFGVMLSLVDKDQRKWIDAEGDK